MTLADLTTFLAWCTLINIGLLLFASLMLMVLRGPIASIHHAMFGLPKENLPMFYFGYVAIYKLLILFFNVVPYIVLRLMVG